MSHIQNTKLIYKIHEEWAQENGYRPQAASVKPEDLNAENSVRFVEAASHKLQAPSSKRQAPSRKRQAP